jgi:antagonist of KipI
MQIRILKPGLMSTIQDMGRYQYLSQAVPVSGAMDRLSACMANKALGNGDNAAVVEFTYADAAFIAETDLLISYAGDGAVLTSEEHQLPAGRPLFILSGTIIKLINAPSGSRIYLAVAGGWDVPEILGSKSTYLAAGFGGLDGRVLQQGDILKNEQRLTDGTKKIWESLKGDKVSYPGWSITGQSFLP